MNPDKTLTENEQSIVNLRYFEGLCNQEVADKLGLRLHQVKYRVRKSNVKKHIRETILPTIRRRRIEELKRKLANPMDAFAEEIDADLHAKTYLWLGPGKRHYYDDNNRQMTALKRLGRILNITGDQKNLERDLRKAHWKLAARLENELKGLEQ